MEGVFEAKKKDGTIYYRASCTYRNKHISLGSYSNPELAHAAYVEANQLLREECSIAIEDYSQKGVLPFEKWLILCNFRNNNIYFASPIYLCKGYFQYYFSREEVFLFDLDDLFYYSSHKLQKRGNRFFVADYGAQIGIGVRYGIKNYAVESKDYVFRNGNHRDYRRQNLEIFNQYHGVSFHEVKKKYQTRIHVNGYLIVGYYDSALEAAIAYNKAVDVLNKNGSVKNYQINFVDEISPRQYAEIYASVKISEKILQIP